MLRDLLDYEDGVTPGQLFWLHIEAAKLLITREKRAQQARQLFVASLFDQKIAGAYMRELDAALKQLNSDAGGSHTTTAKAPSGVSPATSTGKRKQFTQEDVDRSMRELNKLRAILN